MTSTEKVRRNFLGIPVHGDVTPGGKRAVQRPLSDLEPLIRAVLDDPFIDAFGWTQFTPYFNDGDPCVFSVGSVWFRTTDDLEPRTPDGNGAYEYDDEREESDYDDDDFKVPNSTLVIREYGDGHPSLGKREFEWVGTWGTDDRRKVYGPYEGKREASYVACLALSDAVDSEEFDDVLLDAFGDHCQVTVKRTGIMVDEYSHE